MLGDRDWEWGQFDDPEERSEHDRDEEDYFLDSYDDIEVSEEDYERRRVA